MTNAAEFDAAFPEPQVILGLRLLPLSLGRYRLLKRFESPFVSDDSKDIPLNEMAKELFFSLSICGLTCSEFNKLLSAGSLKKEFKRWGKKLRKIVNRKGFTITEPCSVFKRYLETGSAIPWVVLSRQDGSEVSSAHWSTSIESLLRSKVGWTQQEIEEQPLTKALADYFKFLEGEGLVKLYSPDEYQDLQVVAKANGEAFEKILKELNHGA